MPRRLTQTKSKTHQAMKNTSYESMVVSWLMQDGWQVFLPVLDHGHQTDLLISDGPNYYRVQVKTIETNGENIIENKWGDSNVDVVVYFARNSNWGVITPAFTEQKRPLEHKEHRKFKQSLKDFLKEFHQI
jgi:hypothetical protein